jgi:hypothetical protein
MVLLGYVGLVNIAIPIGLMLTDEVKNFIEGRKNG